MGGTDGQTNKKHWYLQWGKSAQTNIDTCNGEKVDKQTRSTDIRNGEKVDN